MEGGRWRNQLSSWIASSWATVVEGTTVPRTTASLESVVSVGVLLQDFQQYTPDEYMLRKALLSNLRRAIFASRTK
jgi:hypothetical protein